MTALFSRFVFPLLLVSLAAPVGADTPSLKDLRDSLANARREAQQAPGLDAAYELVGLADAAQQQNAAEIASEATTLLNTVLTRASEAAMTASIPEAHDAVDQLVDLSFFARTSQVTGADATLQKSLRALLPKVAQDVRAEMAGAGTNAATWPTALTHLTTLGELQAAATLTMLSDLAQAIGRDFDSEAAKLEALARKDARADELLADVKAARTGRDSQLAEAKANDLAAVAAEISGPGRGGRDRAADGSSGGDADVDHTCTETGVLDQEGNMYANQSEVAKLEEECINSGRLPTEDRCPAPNRVYACRESLSPTMERLIYVYRGTPEERMVKSGCKGDILEPGQLSGKTPAFKNTAMRRVVTCMPLGEDENRADRE